MKSKMDLASRRATLLALFALGATLFVAPANAATYTINMTTAELWNLNSWCDGVGDRRYDGCSGINYWAGFNVSASVVPAGETVTSISMAYHPGIDCMGYGWPYNMRLNGTDSAETWSSAADQCWCSWTPEPTVTLTWPASAWSDSGTNQFRIGALFGFLSCIGPQRVGGAYAVLTIETGGGGTVECDLSPIEAKLDDEFRFTDDDEAAEVRDEWNGQLAALEAKMDDLTMGLCDLIRLLHTPSGIRSADCGGQHYEWNADGTLHD